MNRLCLALHQAKKFIEQMDTLHFNYISVNEWTGVRAKKPICEDFDILNGKGHDNKS